MRSRPEPGPGWRRTTASIILDYVMADEISRETLQQMELEDLRASYEELTERLLRNGLELERARADLVTCREARSKLVDDLERCREAHKKLQGEFKERTEWALKLRDELKALKARFQELEKGQKT